MDMSVRTTFFDKFKSNSLAISLSKAASLALNRLAPNWTYQRVEDLLLTPKSRSPDLARLPHGIRSKRISTQQGGELQAYTLGRGPTVVLVHGWSGGAYQFFPMMLGLSQIGFRAIAFDHFAHGHSAGKQASLHSLVVATETVLRMAKRQTGNEGLVGAVGHDLGCVAIANAEPRLLENTALLLISPIYNLRDYFARQIRMPGLHPELAARYMQRLEHSSHMEYDKMHLAVKLVPYADRTVIAHDKSDSVSSYVDSVKFCGKHPLTKLNVTKDLGHERIIHSESVWQQLKSHLNYEDITANPF